MTTPTGAISMLDVIEELDGVRVARAISLNDADVRNLAGVSATSGTPISMNDLRGKSAIISADLSALQGLIVSSEGFPSSQDAEAGVSVKSDGTCTSFTEGGGTQSETPNWLSTGVGSDYEVRATVTAGSTPNGASVNTWLSLGTTRYWNVFESRFGIGTTNTTLTIEIRLASNQNVLATATNVRLEAIML